ncbi:unnamed protein product [Prunus armeniaca]|nr:unnamed protein product [Prunus armeniaca]
MLPNVIVRGINTVQRVVINEVKEEREDSKYKLLAEGTGLLAVMGTEGIDGCKTTSNDVFEVQRTLGIEAARNCIIGEINEISWDEHRRSTYDFYRGCDDIHG